MTDREKKIVEIREALEKATPGTWVYDDICDDIYADKTDVIVCIAVGPENGPLIANAPEWIRFLLSELERLEREYAEERAAHNAHVTELCELEQERYKLIEGLRYLMKELGKLSVKPENATAFHAYKKMRNILHEIGVTVE